MWNSLFTSDVGLFSLVVIVFIIGMAIWFVHYFNKKMVEEEKQKSNQARMQSS